MYLKAPITPCMRFRHQRTFKNVFFSAVSLVWLHGDVICPQIQLTRASDPRCHGRCPACGLTRHCCCRSRQTLQAVPLPLCLSPLLHQLSGFLSTPGAPTSRTSALQVGGTRRLECDDEKSVPVLRLRQKWSQTINGAPRVPLH